MDTQNNLMTHREITLNRADKFSTTEAARILGVSRPTIYSYVSQGLLKYKTRRSNGRRYYTGAELMRFWNCE